MIRIVFNERDRCAEWARLRIPHVESWGEWCETIGLERDGELRAVAVYNFYTGADIAMHIAAVPGRRWMTRDSLRVAFRYPFVQLGCRRVTGYIPAKNADSLRLAQHLGFVREGLKREATEDGDDVVVLGMLKNECRYL